MRQPIHTVYGGAHLFSRDTPAKLGRLALALLDDFGAGHLPHADRIRTKLLREPIEDYRIDFEDGYGLRTSAEEDLDAERAATELAALPTPLPFSGFRIRPFAGATRDRALRTLQLFLRHLGPANIPPNFRITLPKANGSRDAADFIRALGRAEQEFSIPQAIACEFLIETPGAVRSVRDIISAAEGRCVALHFGAYDFLTAMNVSAAAQTLHHPLCDHARAMIQIAIADGPPVALVDGATNAIPARAAGAAAVRNAWDLHQRDIHHSLSNGFYQSWDLHPGQIVSRYAAVYSFFRDSAPALGAQLRHFREQGQRASVLGTDFADSANARGLELHFERAIHCGALTAEELP